MKLQDMNARKERSAFLANRAEPMGNGTLFYAAIALGAARERERIAQRLERCAVLLQSRAPEAALVLNDYAGQVRRWR